MKTLIGLLTFILLFSGTMTQAQTVTSPTQQDFFDVCLEDSESEECKEYQEKIQKAAKAGAEAFSTFISGLSEAAEKMSNDPMIKKINEKALLQNEEVRLVSLVGEHCNADDTTFECGYWKEKLDNFLEENPEL